jgi:hypothetical protein
MKKMKTSLKYFDNFSKTNKMSRLTTGEAVDPNKALNRLKGIEIIKEGNVPKPTTPTVVWSNNLTCVRCGCVWKVNTNIVHPKYGIGGSGNAEIDGYECPTPNCGGYHPVGTWY